MAMRMRQSLAQLEQEFRHEIQRDKNRQEHLRRSAIHRSRRRGIERERKKSSVRFGLLVLTLMITAAVVVAGMFETLYLLLGK